jgi:hypothetical protein
VMSGLLMARPIKMQSGHCQHDHAFVTRIMLKARSRRTAMRSLGIPLSHFVGLAGCKAEESVLDVRYARAESARSR